jgi:hypothetical protein
LNIGRPGLVYAFVLCFVKETVKMLNGRLAYPGLYPPVSSSGTHQQRLSTLTKQHCFLISDFSFLIRQLMDKFFDVFDELMEDMSSQQAVHLRIESPLPFQGFSLYTSPFA